MLQLLDIEDIVLVNGRVDEPELKALRRHLHSGVKIERREADFLVELRQRVRHMTPAFNGFFFRTIKRHILANGQIDAEAAGWLQEWLGAGGSTDGEERAFLDELKSEAKHICPEFEALFEEKMRRPAGGRQ